MPHLRNLRVYDYDQKRKNNPCCDLPFDITEQYQRNEQNVPIVLEADLHYCSRDSCFAMTVNLIRKRLVLTRAN